VARLQTRLDTALFARVTKIWLLINIFVFLWMFNHLLVLIILFSVLTIQWWRLLLIFTLFQLLIRDAVAPVFLFNGFVGSILLYLVGRLRPCDRPLLDWLTTGGGGLNVKQHQNYELLITVSRIKNGCVERLVATLGAYPLVCISIASLFLICWVWF